MIGEIGFPGDPHKISKPGIEKKLSCVFYYDVHQQEGLLPFSVPDWCKCYQEASLARTLQVSRV